MRFSKLDALSAIRDDRTLDAKEKLVSVMLVSHSDGSGECYPSLDRLALETKLARSTVVLVLARLKARGDAAPVHVRSEARGKAGKDGGRPPNKYRLSVTNSVRPPDGSPPTVAGEFRPIQGVVSSDSRGELRPAVGLEAGSEAGEKKLEGEGAAKSAARHRRSSTRREQISESWAPTERQIDGLSKLHNVSVQRIKTTVAEFKNYWAERGAKKDAAAWAATFGRRIADLVDRGKLPRIGERTYAPTYSPDEIPRATAGGGR